MLIVDAHLDIAYNTTRGRDPRMAAKLQPVVGDEIATVGLPDLRAGGVGLVCATIFCLPAVDGRIGYTTADQARDQALHQLDWYRSIIDQGLMRWVKTGADVPKEFDANQPLQSILLLEGADAFRSPADVAEWFDAGLRIVGLAWRQTRFAGGTGSPGPITTEGRALISELDRFGIIHDTSHLAEESFWQLLDLTAGPVIASHSNCRAIVEGDRHLSDEMIRAVAARNGVVGVNFYDAFLIPRAQQTSRRATLNDVVNHIRHICDLAGDAEHVGLGTDMDGGLGREQIPTEIRSSADLPRVADALAAAGFADGEIKNIVGANWVNFFRRSLPE